MPTRKKNEKADGTVSAASETEATGEISAESKADDNQEIAQEQNAGAPGAETGEDAPEPSILQSVVETVSSAVESVAETVVGGVESLVSVVTGDSSDNETTRKGGKRAEKIGVVASDKMTKTVVVRVDRLIKHPIYRKYVKRRKKFMAHDEMGAKIGDKVRIVETRPLSAHKRWRVVEIIQKAEI
jgi:small subunit ribosomal protein S17